MQISIHKPGLLTTVQDLGRTSYLSQAVPPSGAMDQLAARIANKAVGNPDNAAVIEFTYGGAAFNTDTDVLIAYSGEGAFLEISGQALPPGRPLFIPAGKRINLTKNPAGGRTCVAVAGGWDVPEVLGSRSTYLTAGFGGLEGRKLWAQDVIQNAKYLTALAKKILVSLAGQGVNYPDWHISRAFILDRDPRMIRVIPGNEAGWFDETSLADFFSKTFTLSAKSNRMGFHLDGPAMQRIRHQELLSTVVVPGTLQVTGNGKMVMLMADCQTTGGYPRIAQVALADQPLCAQLKPGDQVNFSCISLIEAEKLYFEQENVLNKIDLAIQYKYF